LREICVLFPIFIYSLHGKITKAFEFEIYKEKLIIISFNFLRTPCICCLESISKEWDCGTSSSIAAAISAVQVIWMKLCLNFGSCWHMHHFPRDIIGREIN
jgi:hypothetical protein